MAAACDKNVLLSYGFGLLGPEDADNMRQHVSGCSNCAAYLTTVGPSSDDDASPPKGHGTAVDEMQSLPREAWSQFYASRRSSFESLAAVQALIQACEDALDRDPARAHALTAILVQSADALRPSFTSSALQSISWTRRAATHLRLGQLPDAQVAVASATARADAIPSADYERALIAFTSADILRELGKTDEALAQIRGAAQVFASFRDQRRHASAREMEAAVLFRRGDYADAVSIFLSLLDSSVVVDKIVRGRLAANAAQCFVKIDQPGRALPLFSTAEKLFSEAGLRTYVARIAWGKARALRSVGEEAEALDALEDVLLQFEKLDAMAEWVRVGLEVIEWLLAAGSPADVRDLANTVHKRAVIAGMQLQALEALEYLRTAARESLTADSAQYVRLFIEELRTHPEAIFSPPAAS